MGNANGAVSNYTEFVGGGINARLTQLIGINNKVYSNLLWRRMVWNQHQLHRLLQLRHHGGGWLRNQHQLHRLLQFLPNGGGWRQEPTPTAPLTPTPPPMAVDGLWNQHQLHRLLQLLPLMAVDGIRNQHQLHRLLQPPPYGGGWREGTNTNCTAYSNSASMAVDG